MLSPVLLLVTVLTVHSVNGACLHDDAPLSRRANPAVPIANFSYTGATGPFGWAGLSPANGACSTSKMQSPINLDNAISMSKSTLTVTIPDVSHAELENLGSTLEVVANGTTHFAGKAYTLAQFHFHTPSEHRIANEYFPLEGHFVHQASDGQRLVLGVLFELTTDGTTTALLTALSHHISAVATPGKSTQTSALHFRQIAAHVQAGPLYQYTGSLTTPPCTAGVIWLVAQKPLPVNVKTFLGFKKIMKFNARYTQNTLGQQNLIQLAASQLTHAQ